MKNQSLKKMAVTALFAAISVVLMYLIRLPFPSAPFLPEDHFRSYYNPGNRRCQEAVKKIQISVKMSGDYAPDISFFRNDYFSDPAAVSFGSVSGIRPR